MLKGNNKLVLTHETIIEAVQQYLRAGLVNGERLKVDSVEAQTERSGYGATRTFEVAVSEVLPA